MRTNRRGVASFVCKISTKHSNCKEVYTVHTCAWVCFVRLLYVYIGRNLTFVTLISDPGFVISPPCSQSKVQIFRTICFSFFVVSWCVIDIMHVCITCMQSVFLFVLCMRDELQRSGRLCLSNVQISDYISSGAPHICFYFGYVCICECLCSALNFIPLTCIRGNINKLHSTTYEHTIHTTHDEKSCFINSFCARMRVMYTQYLTQTSSTLVCISIRIQ